MLDHCLILTIIEVIFFVVFCIRLWFGFVMKTEFGTQGCFSYCSAMLRQSKIWREITKNKCICTVSVGSFRSLYRKMSPKSNVKHDLVLILWFFCSFGLRTHFLLHLGNAKWGKEYMQGRMLTIIFCVKLQFFSMLLHMLWLFEICEHESRKERTRFIFGMYRANNMLPNV